MGARPADQLAVDTHGSVEQMLVDVRDLAPVDNPAHLPALVHGDGSLFRPGAAAIMQALSASWLDGFDELVDTAERLAAD